MDKKMSIKEIHNTIHSKLVFSRRVEILSKIFSSLLEDKPISVLDVGCGGGEISAQLKNKSSLDIIGVDILKRNKTSIPVKIFNGYQLPFSDKSFDYLKIWKNLEN